MASENAGSVTSIAPNEKPSGRVARTSVCRPGERSAPSHPWPPAAPDAGQARDGGEAVNASVPTITRTAAIPIAAAGDRSAVATAVSSGPISEDELDDDRVHRIGGREQLGVVVEQRTPERAHRRRDRRDRDARQEPADDEHPDRRVQERQPDDQREAAGM